MALGVDRLERAPPVLLRDAKVEFYRYRLTRINLEQWVTCNLQL